MIPAPQMQVRDYPAPLIAITEITTTGRMVLAEQEARDRGEGGVCVWACSVRTIVYEGGARSLLHMGRYKDR